MKSYDPTLMALKTRLDETVKWPSVYVFKFIVARAEFPQLEDLFAGKPYSTRDSRHGKYVCLTAELYMDDSDQVIAVYAAAMKIKGIITL
jgi:uncharacterized protein